MDWIFKPSDSQVSKPLTSHFPPKWIVEVLTFSILQCGLIWRQLKEAIRILIQYDWCPDAKGTFQHKHMQRECRRKMKAETGWCFVSQGMPKVPANHQKWEERHETNSPSRSSEGHLDLGLLTSRIQERIHFCCLYHPVCGTREALAN